MNDAALERKLDVLLERVDLLRAELRGLTQDEVAALTALAIETFALTGESAWSVGDLRAAAVNASATSLARSLDAIASPQRTGWLLSRTRGLSFGGFVFERLTETGTAGSAVYKVTHAFRGEEGTLPVAHARVAANTGGHRNAAE